MAAHRSTKHPPQAPRMVRIADHHHGAVLSTSAPCEQDLTLRLCSRDGSRNLLNRHHAKRPELTSRSGRSVLVRDSTADELVVRWFDRFREESNSRGDTGVDQVRRFEHAGAFGIDCHDDDVGGSDPIVDDERPSSSAENRSSQRGHEDHRGDQQQDDRCCDSRPPWSPGIHGLIIAEATRHADSSWRPSGATRPHCRSRVSHRFQRDREQRLRSDTLTSTCSAVLCRAVHLKASFGASRNTPAM
jgi:hypothetical protein